MKTRFFLTMTLVVLTLASVSGAAVAQEATNTSTSPTPTAEPVEEETTISLSPTTDITAWSFANGTFSITIESDVPTRVTLTDAGKLSAALSEGGGAATTRVRTRTVTVSDQETITFRATTHDDASAVTVGALNGDGLAVIRTDAMGGGRNPVEWQTTAGLVLGAAVLAAAWTYRKAKQRWEDEKKEVERIA